ncbi:unnamed protein product [Cyprideis torosa]|uniref:Uncharacterized protein n=1 Tax=Cyprideis torosa TaxID=163714 RepID=A0A7R8WPW9_9CRUS|nr:unnamed protein product [Cyprideis torosa]CAG0907549.1 unnamed protein product [Cyprideis torosa]
MAVKALKTDLALNNWKDPEKRISMQRISSTTLGVMFNAFIRSARESVKESPSDPRFQHLIRQAFSQMVDFVAETKAQETVPRSCADDRCAKAHWPDADRPIRFTNHSPDRRRAHKRQRH